MFFEKYSPFKFISICSMVIHFMHYKLSNSPSGFQLHPSIRTDLPLSRSSNCTPPIKQQPQKSLTFSANYTVARLFLCFPRGGHANDGRQQFRHFLPQTSNRRRDLCAAANSSCWQKAQHLFHKPRVPRNRICNNPRRWKTTTNN